MTQKAGILGAIEAVENALSQKIKDQQKELLRWQAQREEAEAGEEGCLRQIAEMELAIAVVKRSVGLYGFVPRTEQLDSIRYRSQTIAQSCWEIMRASGGRAKVKDITKALKDAGKVKGRSAYSTVVKTLDRDERFTRVGVGEFALTEPTQILLT